MFRSEINYSNGNSYQPHAYKYVSLPCKCSSQHAVGMENKCERERELENQGAGIEDTTNTSTWLQPIVYTPSFSFTLMSVIFERLLFAGSW